MSAPTRTRARTGGFTAPAVTAAIALGCGIVTAFAPAGAPRVAAAILLVLVLPGAAISVADRRRSSPADLALTTLGGSIALTILAGLLLYVLPTTMGRLAWSAVLTAIVVSASLLAAVAPSPGDTGTASPLALAEEQAEAGGPSLPRPVNVVLGLLAVAVAVTAVLLARDAADRALPFSELSAVAQGSDRILVRVHSHEAHPASYRVAITGLRRRPMELTILLAPGQGWQRTLALPAPQPRGVHVALYRAGASTAPLRTVTYLPPGAAFASLAAGVHPSHTRHRVPHGRPVSPRKPRHKPGVPGAQSEERG